MGMVALTSEVELSTSSSVSFSFWGRAVVILEIDCIVEPVDWCVPIICRLELLSIEFSVASCIVSSNK